MRAPDAKPFPLPSDIRDVAGAEGWRELYPFFTRFRAADAGAEVFAPLPDVLMRVHRELKKTFDPHGILNPGRLYADL